MGFTGFYWVSFGLIRFHMTWLDLTEFYWVLLGFNGVDCMKIDIGSGFIGFHWVLPSFHRDEQVLLDIAGLRLGSNWLDCVCLFFYRVLLSFSWTGLGFGEWSGRPFRFGAWRPFGWWVSFEWSQPKRDSEREKNKTKQKKTKKNNKKKQVAAAINPQEKKTRRPVFVLGPFRFLEPFFFI